MTVSLKQWYFSCSQKNFQSFWWLHSTRVPLEKAMAPHSRNLAWKIPWMAEPGRLKSTGSLRVRHDWATSLSLFTFVHWRRKCNPLQCSCLENPRDRGAWWAAVYGVAQSRTRLKWISSSSSRVLKLGNLHGYKHRAVFPSQHLPNFKLLGVRG